MRAPVPRSLNSSANETGIAANFRHADSTLAARTRRAVQCLTRIDVVFTLQGPVHAELLIKKSRFIACVQPVEGRVQAREIIAALRDGHPGAAHVCWALMAGGQSAANDDGEPGGTAGRPMLEVLRHHQLEGVLATVVRYFGGVKLGAGGLVRAYTDAVAQALLGAALVPRVARRALHCVLPYDCEGMARRELAAAQAQIEQVRHEAQVHLHFSAAETDAPGLIARINNMAQGRARWLA